MSSRDQRSTWIGTVTYMSPERFRGGLLVKKNTFLSIYKEPYSWDTDIWSFGVCLLECAWGRYPYPNLDDVH